MIHATAPRTNHMNNRKLLSLALIAVAPFQAYATVTAVEFPTMIESGRILAIRMESAKSIDELAKELGRDFDAAKLTEANLKLLYAHEIIDRIGEKAITAECAKSPDFRAFLSEFLTDRLWMEDYVTLMNVPRKIEGLRALADIWKAHGKSADFARYKALACSIASAWGGPKSQGFIGMQKRGETSPEGRFGLVRKLHQDGRLSGQFDSLHSWDLEYIGWFSWDDGSLAWLNRSVRLPDTAYTSIEWCGEYSYYTVFGDNIQTGFFYTPWAKTMGMAENIARHGAVCGGVSTTACMTAIAHGIPGYTLGQPGHCAYTIRYGQEWRGGFGGPEGEPHHPTWDGGRCDSFAYVLLSQEVRSARDSYLASTRHLCAAKLFGSTLKNRPRAEAAHAAALTASPRNLNAWRELVAFQKAGGNASPDTTWKPMLRRISSEAAKGDTQGRVFYELMSEIIANQLKDSASEADSIAALTAAMPSMMKQQPTWNWSVEKALNASCERMTKQGVLTIANSLIECALGDKDAPASSAALTWLTTQAAKNRIAIGDFSTIHEKIFAEALRRDCGGSDKRTAFRAQKFATESYKNAIIKATELKNHRLAAILRLELHNFLMAQIPEKFCASVAETGPRPTGNIISADALFTDYMGNAQDWHYLFTGAKTPFGPRDLAFRYSNENWVAFTMQIPDARTATGLLIVPSPRMTSTPIAIRISYSTDGTKYTPLSEGVIPPGGRLNKSFAPTKLTHLKIEMKTTKPQRIALSVMSLFGAGE